jgi:hypothetical protein
VIFPCFKGVRILEFQKAFIDELALALKSAVADEDAELIVTPNGSRA